jgi:hypothetical protein
VAGRVDGASVTSDVTIHVAGLTVTVEGQRLRQRCAWCGTIMIDVDLTLVAVQEGDQSGYPTFPTSALVEMSDDRGVMYVVAEASGTGESSGRIRPNSCMILDPDVTA